jgi:hypothetical protein
MNIEKEHVSPWLGAYIDNELADHRRVEVETHLAHCQDCRAQLEELRALTSLLHADPLPAAALSETDFTAQVLANLPRRAEPQSWGLRILHLTWKFAPLGLFGAWAFFQAVVWVSGVLLVALEFIPAGQQAFEAFLPFASGSGFTPSLLELDLLNALLQQAPLELPVIDLLSPLVLLNLLLMLVLGVLFLSWLASWWIYQRSQQK